MLKRIFWLLTINLIIPTFAFAEDNKPFITPEVKTLIKSTLGHGIGAVISGLIILGVTSWLADIVLDPLNKKDLATKIYLIIRFYAYVMVVKGGLDLVGQVLSIIA